MQPTLRLTLLLLVLSLLGSASVVAPRLPAPTVPADRSGPPTSVIRVAAGDAAKRWDESAKVLLLADGNGRRRAARDADKASADPNAPSSDDASRRARTAQRPSAQSRNGAPPLPGASPSNPTTAAGDGTAAEAAARNDAEVAAARARVEEMQAYSEAHIKDMADAAKTFETKMKSATTPEERKALQQEYLALQRAKQEEFQRRMTEMKSR